MEQKLNIQKIKDFLSRYRYAALVLIIGIAFMLLPERNTVRNKQEQTISQQPVTQTEAEQLSDILKQIQGAGDVQVMLSVKAGEELLYQTDIQKDSSNDSNAEKVNTILVSDSNREESGLIRQVIPPRYLGAVVVCQGADSSTVRLAITEAVSKITGLGADSIVVLKMK